MLFGIFKYEVECNLCKILNENEYEFELENENVKVNCEYDCSGLFNGPLCPPPHPTPHPKSHRTSPHYPTVLNCIDSCGGLPEQLVLNDLFDIVYGGNIIVYNLNNVCDCFNENFYCDGYYCGVLSPPYPTPTPDAPIVDFINSRAELREQLVLKDLFDIIYGDFGIENNVINQIYQSMFIFIF